MKHIKDVMIALLLIGGFAVTLVYVRSGRQGASNEPDLRITNAVWWVGVDRGDESLDWYRTGRFWVFCDSSGVHLVLPDGTKVTERGRVYLVPDQPDKPSLTKPRKSR